MVLDGKDKGKALKFGSWEERCNACRVYGADQEPCVSLDVYQRDHPDRECPRVVLDPLSADLVMLANMAIAESPLLATMLETFIEGEDPDRAREFIQRIEAVRTHPSVTSALERARERAEKAAAAKRKGR